MNNGRFSDRAAAYLVHIPEALTDEQREFVRSEYASLGREAAVADAARRKIVPFAAHTLMNLGCDPEFWSASHVQWEARNREIVCLLDHVFRALEEVGCESCRAAENFGVILSTGACLGCFCSGDVDVYIDEADKDLLAPVMERFGFVRGDRQGKRIKSFAQEYINAGMFEKGFWINCQWRPVTRFRTHLYDQRYLLARYAEEIRGCELHGDTHIRILRPDALLYFNVQHIASCHYYTLTPGLRLYVDIDRAARSGGIDWEEIDRWAKEDENGFRKDMVLKICTALLDTPIPAEAFSQQVDSKRLRQMFSYLLNPDTLAMRDDRRRGYLATIRFLLYTELWSDNVRVSHALWRRLYVVAMTKD